MMQTFRPMMQTFQPFACQYAKTDRSKCRSCDELIEQNSMRFSHRTYLDRWYHNDCFWPIFDSTVSPYNMDGLDSLRREDYQKIVAKIKENGPKRAWASEMDKQSENDICPTCQKEVINFPDENDYVPAKKRRLDGSDTELTTVIKGLLKEINLEEVTMKEMWKMIYDEFPGVNLAERKDFIKTTVKSIIKSVSPIEKPASDG